MVVAIIHIYDNIGARAWFKLTQKGYYTQQDIVCLANDRKIPEVQ